MAYVPQFTNDIFISYRHASNESDAKWVDTFCENLRTSLDDLVGKVTIWRDDPALRAGDRWRPEIARALDSTAIFLAIVSRTYFDSDVCRAELDRFLARVKDQKAVIRHPIVPVFKAPPKKEQGVPQEIKEYQHHEFFQWDPPGSDRWREFVPGGDQRNAHDFFETLSRLAQDLTIQLETLSGLARKCMQGTVFLARVGPELHPEREKLRSDLLQRGYWVVPERAYLWNATNFDTTIAEDLNAAQLCIHIVGRTASIEPDTHARTKSQLELAVTAMKGRNKPSPLVWVQPAKETNSETRSLINYIEQDLANEGIEYWQGSLEDFKTQIYDQLSNVAVSTRASKDGDIAMIVEERDIGATGALNDVLADRLGKDPQRIIFFEARPKERPSMVKTLARCEQCLVFWGSQSEEWVRDVLALDELKGRLGWRLLGVCVAEPATPEKTTFRTNKARVLNGIPTVDESQLRDFIAMKETAQ